MKERPRPMHPAFAFRRPRAVRAFTLIELIACIGIIAIIASLLIAGLSATKQHARGVRCVNNLREIGVAVLLYAANNKNTLPGPFSTDQQSCEIRRNHASSQFPNTLAPYLHTIVPTSTTENIVIRELVCPVWEAASNRYDEFYNVNPPGTGNTASGDTTPTIWRINNSVFGGGGGNHVGTRNINVAYQEKTPDKLWLMRELSDPSPTSNRNKMPNNGRWHGNYINAVYLDGHVGRMSPP